MTSCCKYDLNKPRLAFFYPNLKTYDYIVERSYNLKDTIEQQYIETVIHDSQNNHFRHSILLTSAYKYFIIEAYRVIENSSDNDSILVFSDTISNVQFELKGRCNKRVENLSYWHNGKMKSDLEIFK